MYILYCFTHTPNYQKKFYSWKYRLYPWNELAIMNIVFEETYFSVLVSMAVKHNNTLLNLITGCLYWLTTCFGQLHDHHQVYKS